MHVAGLLLTGISADYSFIDAIVDENVNDDNFRTGGEACPYELEQPAEHDNAGSYEDYGSLHLSSSFDLDDSGDQPRPERKAIGGEDLEESHAQQPTTTTVRNTAPSSASVNARMSQQARRRSSRHALDPREYLEGPFCSRAGRGRLVKRAIKNVFILPQNAKKSIAARRPHDVDAMAAEVDHQVAFFDGMKTVDVPLDAYGTLAALAIVFTPLLF